MLWAINCSFVQTNLNMIRKFGPLIHENPERKKSFLSLDTVSKTFGQFLIKKERQIGDSV